MDNKPPLQGTPEYRRRYWLLLGLRALSLAALLVSVVLLVLGHPPVDIIAAGVAVLALVVGLVAQVLLMRLIFRGRNESRDS